MNAPSIDIKDILTYDESGDSSSELIYIDNLFIGREPAKPSNCVTIFDTISGPPQLNFVDQGYEYPSVQIRVRDIDYDKGWILINKIKDLLHGRANQTWNGTFYASIACSMQPGFLDWDENNRARFVVSFNIQRR